MDPGADPLLSPSTQEELLRHIKVPLRSIGALSGKVACRHVTQCMVDSKLAAYMNCPGPLSDAVFEIIGTVRALESEGERIGLVNGWSTFFYI